MWRSEKNTFVRTTPAQPNTPYSSQNEATPVASASPAFRELDHLSSLGGLNNANHTFHSSMAAHYPSDSGRWFHVPGSTRRAALEQTNGLVSSSLHSSTLAASALYPSHSTEPVGSAGYPEWNYENARPQTATAYASSAAVNSVDAPYAEARRADALAHDTSNDVSRLLRQYRDENQHLREQLRAKALHETHLVAKLEELGRRYAALQLDCQRAARDPAVLGMLSQAQEDTGERDGNENTLGDAFMMPARVQAQLCKREDEVQHMQLTVRELEGRVEAYREALQKARAYRPEATTVENAAVAPASATVQGVKVPVKGVAAPLVDVDESCTSTAAAVPLGAPASLHALLLESLNTADFLVKVFNALQHCQYSRHRDDAGEVDLPAGLHPPSEERFTSESENGTSCPRSRSACALRCLRAAMQGAALSPDLRVLADGPENNTVAANTEAALAVREELAYCETVAVRLAATLVSGYAEDQEATSTMAEVQRAASLSSKAAAARTSQEKRTKKVPEGKSTSSSPSRTSREETAAAEPNSTEKLEAFAEKTSNDVASSSKNVAAKAPRSKAARCRPELEDCEVQ